MGTSIECFFASNTEWMPEELAVRLNDLCVALQADLAEIRRNGRFSSSTGGWSVWRCEGQTGDADRLEGEGPSGFGIRVYPRVICLTSVERFGALYDEAFGVVAPLRRVLCSLAVSLAQPAKVAIAPAGFGDTDLADDAAYLGGSFEDVWRELDARPPTNDWASLKEWDWYLGPPIPDPPRAPPSPSLNTITPPPS